MAILMQGSWNIHVHQKNAAREQRFIITGAATGNGTHPGVVGSPMVLVTGTDWNVTIQSKSGSTWLNSTEKIQFPTSGASGFIIRSDDATATPDKDFDDLVIHCIPVSVSGATDYITYGNVSCYKGFCRFNPCFPKYLVIDSQYALNQALRQPVLREYIQKVYPDKIFETRIKLPIPVPDPAPFTPLMLPLQNDDLLPQKEATIFRKEMIESKSRDSMNNTAGEKFVSLSSVKLNNFAPVRSTSLVDRVKLAGLMDKLRLQCEVDAIPSAILRVIEYDRTASEKAGGAYTGTGSRVVLGYAITDAFGNYVFRYQRTDFDDLSEVVNDVAAGENIFVQAKPDLIVQLLDPFDPGIVLHETALNTNVSTFKRINMCFPCTKGPKPCNGQGIIQYIGDLLVIKGATGTRGGDGNILGSTGKISNGSLHCAAWTGSLNLIACLSNDAIKFYTVRYKRPFEAASQWKLVTEDSRLPKFNGVDPLPVSTTIRRIRTIQLDGVVTPNVACYENVENSADANEWIAITNKKATLSTSIYVNDKLFVEQQGTMQFRIEGYDAAGNKIAGVDETIDLYLDNRWLEADIDPLVQLGSTTLGNCALFTLPSTVVNGVNVVSDERVPLTVRFRAKQASGFMGQYALTISKGAIGNIALVRNAGAGAVTHTTALPTGAGQYAVGRVYSDNVNLVNCTFNGTPDEPGSIGDYIELTIRPESTWLEPDQNFCAFRIVVSGYIRHTDGENSNPNYQTNEVLIGIERPE